MIYFKIIKCVVRIHKQEQIVSCNQWLVNKLHAKLQRTNQPNNKDMVVTACILQYLTKREQGVRLGGGGGISVSVPPIYACNSTKINRENHYVMEYHCTKNQLDKIYGS